ncbi:CDP-glycerol glycerophosphotransferase family protein [Candidatus Lokiarchaeum ossiferum]|uniref:CDP-glycerol glycerophosphotransferase family protein n=1 Tax=Candidatus Lokiarchaeum ossiferum TaxID=2951803 RepID=UPI00352C5578
MNLLKHHHITIKKIRLVIRSSYHKISSNLKYIHQNISKTENDLIIEYFLKILKKINLLKSFSNLFSDKLNPKIISFGSMNGNMFIDNPMHLFLYIKNQDTDFNCFWFTRSRKVFQELSNKGYAVIYHYSLRAIKVLKASKFLITGWSVNSDFLPIKFSKQTNIIQTWHGSQFKKVLNDTGRPFKEVLEYSNQYYMISPGKNITPFINSAFQVQLSHIFVTGLPRNDYLFNSSDYLIQDLRQKYHIPKNIERIILYAPTYRKTNYTATFPLSIEEKNKLNLWLEQNNTVLLCKSHFANKIEIFGESKNIYRIDKYTQTQELILISDVLITDYSTLFFDFILIDKPVILFPYDYKEYLINPGIYFDLEEIAVGPVAYTNDHLLSAITSMGDWMGQYVDPINNIRNKYWDYVDGNACERFLDILTSHF